MDALCLALFATLMLLPPIYGMHLALLALLTHRRQHSMRAAQQAQIAVFRDQRAERDWPTVTTQIPLYNEQHVAARVIDAAARIDYPLGRHQIQVLDDSTDITRTIVDRTVAEWRARGVDIVAIRRPDREHYKAGALQSALPVARGELIAIFDADFTPPRDFLRQLVPLIADEPRVACVQGRWGHLNADQNWIADAIGIGIDGHFGVEQPARAWNDLLLNFNGTAGIWRKAAIADPAVGGWQGDTITEDLDLSYRAQLAGWRLLYCPDVVAPAEIPADVDALKAQQTRWATGSLQTARKLLPAVWRSRLTLTQKLAATIHLTQYMVNVFMVAAIAFGHLLLLPLDREDIDALLTASGVPCLIGAVGSWSAYVYGRWMLGGGLVGPLGLTRLIVLGMGLSLNNTVAVIAGLFQRGGEFVRTPKTGAGAGRAPQSSAYKVMRSRLWLAELLVGGLCLLQWVWFINCDVYFGATFLLLYAIGLILLGWASRPRWTPPPPPPPRREPAPTTSLPMAGGVAGMLPTSGRVE